MRWGKSAEMMTNADEDEKSSLNQDNVVGVGGNNVEESWSRICACLRREVGESEYRVWLEKITLGAIRGDELILLLPDSYLRDTVRDKYGHRLSELWLQENKNLRRINFSIGRCGGETPVGDLKDSLGQDVLSLSERGGDLQDSNNDWQSVLDKRFTFDTFVVGKPNEFAYACARRVAEMPASVGFNPFFLYGSVGLGKTHLMHAIGAEIIKTGQRSVAYMSAEKFMYRFIAAIRSQSIIEFKEQLRSVNILMIDDIQFLIGKDNTQEEFFHTFNAIVEAGRQIVVSSDKPPSDLSGLEDRLRTRLGCGMVADIHATTFELRVSILESKVKTAGVIIPIKVIEFLAHKITSNVRELEGALNRLIAHATLFNRPVTLDVAQEVLHDILKAYDRRVTIEEIQKKVAEHWNIRLTDMFSARRARNVARPRQVAMYLAKQLTSCSLPEIGKKFGNRDHTTVMHAVSRVDELIQQDSILAEEVALLRRMLESA